MKKEIQQVKTEEATNTPEIKFRAGAISATVWVNQGERNGQPSQYRTISIERNYTDKEGNWQKTSSFRINDLPKAWLILQKAYEHAIYNTQTLRGE